MAKIITEEKMKELLDWSYEKVIDGVPGLGTAEDLANDYLKQNGSLEEQVNSLIRWQNTKCATSGFLSGLGGLITLPVAVPANISSVLYVQIRMIAAIAVMGGYDIRDDKVKTMVFLCLCGNSAAQIVKKTAKEMGIKFAKNMITNISREAIVQINKKVGFKLVTKFGEKGIINLSKTIPLVGGVVGAGVDGVATNIIGNTAKKAFIIDNN